jgi:hypothetical protein
LNAARKKVNKDLDQLKLRLRREGLQAAAAFAKLTHSNNRLWAKAAQRCQTTTKGIDRRIAILEGRDL